MAWLTEVSHDIGANGHSYRVFAPDPESDWLRDLAERYTALRTETLAKITDVKLDGLTEFSTDQLIKALTAAVIPARGKGNFSVARSDFGELIAFVILERVYGTGVGHLNLRDRELVQQPGRGPGVLGVEADSQGTLALIVGETKTTTDGNSPPAVVDSSSQDCLRAQFEKHRSDLAVLGKKVLDAARKARDKQVFDQMLAIGAKLSLGKADGIRLIAHCCLVRQREHHKPTDFGVFHASPEDFSP